MEYYMHVPEYSYLELVLSIMAALGIIIMPYNKIYKKMKNRPKNS
jgi:hypothetical protein